jgi:tetratricopeptide (TPR) repeat protein
VYGQTRYTSSRAIREKLGLVQAEWSKHEPHWPVENLSYIASDMFLLYARIEKYNRRFNTEVFPYFPKGSRNDKMEFIPFKVLGDFNKTKTAKIEAEFNNLKNEADNNFKYKRYDSAVKLYKQALKLKPNDTDLPSLIAKAEKEAVKEKEENKIRLEKETMVKAIEDEFETNTVEINNANKKAYNNANHLIKHSYSTKKIVSDDISQYIEEYITVQRKLVTLSKSTNKTLEKALKKAETYTEVKAAVGM